MIILFDGVCNLCNGAVNFIIDHDKKNVFKFASLQSEYGQNFLKKNKLNASNFKSIILLDGENYYIKSKAIYKIMGKLPFPYFFLSYLSIIPLFISDTVYDMVARNRYSWFGKKESCRIPTKEILSKFIE